MRKMDKNIRINNINISVGDQPFEVFASLSGTLDGINVYVGGGTDPHIGAVAISTPRPSLKNPENLSFTTSVFNCIGHKDDVIAKLFSEALCLRYNCVVVVSAGVHIDHISIQEITQLQQLSAELLNMATQELDDLIANQV